MPSGNDRGDDNKFERLVYIQAEDEVINQGNVTVPDVETMANLSAISMCVAWADDTAQDYDTLLEQEHMTFVSPAWRDALTPEEWGAKMLSYIPSCINIPGEDLQDMFTRTVENLPNYGQQWFHVKLAGQGPGRASILPKYILYGFSHIGLTICDMEKNPLLTYPYSDIYRWGGSSSQFSLILSDNPAISSSTELVVVTTQAQDMAAIILDYIRALMKAAK